MPSRMPWKTSASRLIREQAVEAARETVALVHPEPYIQSIIDAVPLEGLVAIDEDTSLSPGTLDAALQLLAPQPKPSTR